MEKNSIIFKILVAGIILLLIGDYIIPVSANNILKETSYLTNTLLTGKSFPNSFNLHLLMFNPHDII